MNPTRENPEAVLFRASVDTVDMIVKRLLIVDRREVADRQHPGVRMEATVVGARSMNTASVFVPKQELYVRRDAAEEHAVHGVVHAVGDPLFVAIARGIEAVAKAVCTTCQVGEVGIASDGVGRIVYRYPSGRKEYADGPIVWMHHFTGVCQAGILWDAIGVAGVARLSLADEAHDKAKARAIAPKTNVRIGL